ncbi:hypothetical protein BJV77DRAFT_617439 [Russula vinacea]|nr:hypothetical protein BJV77DRAFT_617439 [Russula vinacea]
MFLHVCAWHAPQDEPGPTTRVVTLQELSELLSISTEGKLGGLFQLLVVDGIERVVHPVIQRLTDPHYRRLAGRRTPPCQGPLASAHYSQRSGCYSSRKSPSWSCARLPCGSPHQCKLGSMGFEGAGTAWVVSCPLYDVDHVGINLQYL